MDLSRIAEEVKGELNRFGRENGSRFEDVERKAREIETRLTAEIDRVGAALRRMHAGGRSELEQGGEPAPESKAFYSYLAKGYDALPELERKLLSVNDDPRGGYLAPPETARDIIRAIKEGSPLRRLCRVVQTAAGGLDFPKQTSGTTASWVGEEEARSETNMRFGSVLVQVHELATYLDVTIRLLEDAAQSIPDIMNLDLGEAFAAAEAQAFLLGDGVKRPWGILQSADLTKIASGATAELTPDGLISLVYSLKPSYRRNARWLMSNTTAATVRKMKSAADGTYLWQDQGRIIAGEPSTLLGYPVEIDDNMPSIGANAVPVLFGDFGRAYVILEKASGPFTVLRDPFSIAGSGKVRFHARSRVGGGLIRAEALVAQKVATS